MKWLFSLVLTLSAMSAALDVFGEEKIAKKIYNEMDGTVIMEMEGTTSPMGKWVQRTSLEPFSGRCYLEFMGNNEGFGPADSPLKYTFKINSDGNYWISIRSHKRLTGDDGKMARADMCNDCYLRVEGDYRSGNPKLSLEQLRKDAKFWGGSADLEWSNWANRLVHDDDIQEARYQFKAGKVYTIVISGRAQRFSLDRIVVTRNKDQRFNMQDKESPLQR